MNILDDNYSNGKFRGREVYSDHLVALIKSRSNKLSSELLTSIDEIREVERNVRNPAAHSMVSVTEEWFYRRTGFTIEKTMNILKYLVKEAGIPVEKEYWQSYDKMNEMLNQMISG